MTASAQTPADPPAPQDTSTFCQNVGEENPFTDLSSDNVHYDNILCLVAAEITQGTTATTYSPAEGVRRDQMASFIARLIDTANELETEGTELQDLPAHDGENDFPDVTSDNVHLASINRLADAGVVLGKTDGTYDPREIVKRDQMGSFINRALDYLVGAAGEFGDAIITTNDYFADDDGNVHEDNINDVADAGIYVGTTAPAGEASAAQGTADPRGDTRRDQMGSFLIRGMAELEEQGLITPLPGEEPATNQTFTVTDSAASTNQVSSSAIDNTGRRAYEVSGLEASTTYDIRLFPSENVTDTDGTISFADEDGTADHADPGSTPAVIELVNGTAVTPAAAVEASSTADGTLTFTIDSQTADSVIPAIWLDEDTTEDDALDLNADDTPSEPFGIGGEKTWIPAEAAQGALAADATVQSVNRDSDYFIANDGADETYFYDSNDVFRLNNVAITMAQFEGFLTGTDVSAGDILEDANTNYEPDAADSSTFDVLTDNVAPPTDVEAAVSDTDGDGTQDDVTVTWTASAQPDAVYDVFRNDDSIDTACDGANETQIASNISATSVTDTSVSQTSAPFSYCVRAEGTTSGNLSSANGTRSNQVTVPPAPDTAAPVGLTNGSVVDVDGGLNDIADSGDTWVLYFDEDVNAAADAAMQVTDGGGDTIIVENGVNSTWTATDNAVTIVINQTLQDGTDPLNYSLTINLISGVSDDAGNVSDVADLTDVTLEDDGAEFLTETETADIGDTTFTVEFNEPMDATSVQDEANWIYTDASAGGVTIDTVTLGADGRTATITLTGVGVEAGDDVSFTGDDSDGQTGTATLTGIA